MASDTGVAIALGRICPRIADGVVDRAMSRNSARRIKIGVLLVRGPASSASHTNQVRVLVKPGGKLSNLRIVVLFQANCDDPVHAN